MYKYIWIYILPTNGNELLMFPGLYKNSYSFQGPSILSLPSIITSGLPSTPVIRRNNP